MATFDTLSAFDAQFLYWDSDATPMNMGNLCIFEGGPLFDESGSFRLEDVRRAIASRLHLVPRYRRRVLEVPGGFAHPVLVDDPNFDIANHVRLVRLPEPGDERRLKEAFARAHEGMLSHDRPLWEITFIEGLEDGRVGMVQKIHHAPFDGATTVEVMSLLFASTPAHAEIEPPPWRPEPPPDPLSLVGAKWGEQVMTFWKGMFGGAVAATNGPQALGEIAEAVASLGRIPQPPPTSLNRPVGPRRRFEWITTTLSDAKEIRGLVPGSTVNDVMLAAVAGGLRDLLAGRGEHVDALVLQVMIPVSLRAGTGSGPTVAGNQLTGFVAPLPVCERDPVRRLERIHASTRELKESGQARGIQLMTQTTDFAPASLMAAAGRAAIEQSSFMNLTVTNVPGPPNELYLLGAKMLELNPMVPIGNQLTLNVAVESYAGKLSVGLAADADANPDLEVMRDGIARALEELLGRARG